MGTRDLLELILNIVTRTEKLLTQQQDRVLDARAACRLTGLSKASLYSKTCSKNGQAPVIPHFKTGKRIYFRESELVAWMTANRVKDREAIEREAEAYVNGHPIPNATRTQAGGICDPVSFDPDNDDGFEDEDAEEMAR